MKYISDSTVGQFISDNQSIVLDSAIRDTLGSWVEENTEGGILITGTHYGGIIIQIKNSDIITLGTHVWTPSIFGFSSMITFCQDSDTTILNKILPSLLAFNRSVLTTSFRDDNEKNMWIQACDIIDKKYFVYRSKGKIITENADFDAFYITDVER
ncbi:MAG: hypothetical protein WCY93_07440 [Anaerolineaceae bacterium]